jgi:cysteine desulfurase
VLTALGYDRETAQTAVRFTFGRSTTSDQLDEAADALVRVASAHR